MYNNIVLTPILPIVISIVSVLVIFVIVFFIVYYIRKNSNKIVIDDDFIDEFIEAFGGLKNIKSLDNENGGRLCVNVDDLDLVTIDLVKSLAVSGVFITGNTIKTLYRENSSIIKAAIEKRLSLW